MADDEITGMVNKINKYLNVEMTFKTYGSRYHIYVGGNIAHTGGYTPTLAFLDRYWEYSQPMTVQVTDELKATIKRLLGTFQYVVVDYQGPRGTGDRYAMHEGTLFNQSTFDYYQANGWPSEL